MKDLKRLLKESWASIDELLRQVSWTEDKNEKTRLLNMVGAQRARIFIRMGHYASNIDFDALK